MADNTTVELGGKSRHEIAFELMKLIANLEGRSIHHRGAEAAADRSYILTTYVACIRATAGVT
jgi:hypothetical protein